MSFFAIAEGAYTVSTKKRTAKAKSKISSVIHQLRIARQIIGLVVMVQK